MFKSYPDFRAVLHGKEDVIIAVDRHEFHHAVPEADIVFHDGVVLLAAYPTEKLSDSTGLISIYGTEDKILDRKQYDDSKKYFPSHYTEIPIVGGNHAQFGNYGFQSGDGEANITAHEQQTQTAFAILNFSKEIG